MKRSSLCFIKFKIKHYYIESMTRNNVIERYLRDTGIDLCTWTRNGMRVIMPIQDKIIHNLLSSYVKQQLKENKTMNDTQR
jgi:hypothetical protein